MNMNKKRGFTIIGLLAAIFVLSIVTGTSAYIIKNSKNKDYKSLINSLAKASEEYFIDCVYTGECTSNSDVSISTLVAKGYLSSNNKKTILNPRTNEDISDCVITIEFKDDDIIITPKSDNAACSKIDIDTLKLKKDLKENIKIKEPSEAIIYGDANNDGKINAIDLIIMSKYVSGTQTTNINLTTADLNADGKVDDIDCAIFKKYLAGWNIEFPYNSGNIYDITYNLNGGQELSRNITRYAEISLPHTLNEPTREGYAFIGWTGGNGNIPQKNITITSKTTGNKNYIANWALYGDANSDGKVNEIDAIVMTKYVNGVQTTNINLTTADLNADGKVDDIDCAIFTKYLAGWNIEFPYNSGNIYDITYNLNGGQELSRNITRYAEISLPHTLNEPTREGYAFIGWTGSNGNIPQKNVTITSKTTGNKNYIANWALYGDANGDGKVNEIDAIVMTKYVNGVQTTNINLTTADLNADGKVDDIDCAIFTKYLSGANIKFPYNAGNIYEITYNLNGGQELSRNITRYAEISLPYTLNEPTREGYAFIGWTGSNGDIPQKNVTITSKTTENKNYIANWALYGDANGDGKVNILDLMAITKYIGGAQNTNIVLNAADLNADGKVDNKDSEILKKYLAGENIKFPYTN